MDTAHPESGSVNVTVLAKNSDVLLAAGVVGILVCMVIPLPPVILDVLLSMNIAFSLVLVLVATYIRNLLNFRRSLPLFYLPPSFVCL